MTMLHTGIHGTQGSAHSSLSLQLLTVTKQKLYPPKEPNDTIIKKSLPLLPLSPTAVAVATASSEPSQQSFDIICYQEFKCTKDKILREGLQGRYSGVSTLTSHETPITTPLYAQEGFLGSSPPPSDPKTQTSIQNAVHAIITSPDDGFTEKELRDMDTEGRLLISDHGLFVLINGYFPRATPHETDRYTFKLRFQRAISILITHLSDTLHRSVVLLGDLNVCHKPIDHCDPSNNIRENKLDAFGETDGRVWVDSLVGGTDGQEGMLVDLFRLLVDWFVGCDVRQDVMGSDHCPVVATLAGVNRKTGELLRDVMGHRGDGGTLPPPPPGCAELWEEVSGKGKQTSLKEWFVEGQGSGVGANGGIKRKSDLMDESDGDLVKPVVKAAATTTTAATKPAVLNKKSSNGGGGKQQPLHPTLLFLFLRPLQYRRIIQKNKSKTGHIYWPLI
ncbi:UNVERIFIED_CONTAM: Class II abasic (AP) endonuclease [Siphonaria sp. JEL0065]|nr:Class II abasic (AP) endonuclease [Siphonaria sp. JEL0065]